MQMARVAVFFDNDVAAKRWKYGINAFECYITEVLGHAGIPFQQIADIEELSTSFIDIAIIALADEDQITAARILAFAEQGGTVISYGGLPRLAEKLGGLQRATTGVSYVTLPHGLGDSRPLRCLHTFPWELQTATSTGTGAVADIKPSGSIRLHLPEGDPLFSALQQFRIGRGSIERWAVNIPAEIVAFQQGTQPVLVDGAPAPDGTANTNEGILKGDDGIEMDWDLDRLHTDLEAVYFAHPYADLWREACIAHLLQTVVANGLTLPFIAYWPDGIQSVATISHDSDGNVNEHADSTLKVLAELEIQSTWCMLEPGYSTEIYQQVAAAGHELAFHYNALDEQGGKWGEAEFARQFKWLQDATGQQHITTNKNHYTRFEGWGELFQWCEQHGIAMDQTRGSSKGGNVGFLFGTCHPFFPVAWADEHNRMYDVLELGFLTQDMDIGKPWANSSIITPFLEQVMQVKGVAHFLFHQVHIHTKPKVVEAFRKLVAEARQAGFTFWKAEQINAWERLRRRLQVTAIDQQGQVQIQKINGTNNAMCREMDELHNVVVWVPVVEGTEEGAEETTAAAITELQFGIPCRKQIYRLGGDLF